MFIRNKWLSLVWKVLLVLICGYGLFIRFRRGDFSSLNYYTVLSNIVVFAYFLGSVIFIAGRLGRGADAATWRPSLEGATVFCITVTFLIYHFMLRPETFRMGGEGFWTYANLSAHYIVPIMALLDWLLFMPKGVWRKWEPASWLAIPLVYFIYILVRAPFAGNIGGTSSPYPYFFIDVDKLGWEGVLANAVWIAIAMLALAYLMFFIDRGVARLGRGRK